MSASELVKSYVNDNKVMVFSKSYCPYCTKAKNALNKFTEKYTVLELEDRDDCSEIQEVLGEMTGETTVPRVFIGGKFVGGGDETARLAASGKLKTLLEAAGVEVKA